MQPSTILFGAFAIASGAAAQTVSLRIEAPGQVQFRIGEAIPLKLIFEMTPASDAPSPSGKGWMITWLGHDRSVLGFSRDRFVVSPETGTRDPWDYRLHEGITYAGPPGTRLGDKRVVLDIDLNQWVRFERPGHYAVHTLSHAIGPQQNVNVESNQIAIHIIAADPQWQAQESADDVAILNSTLSKIDGQAFEEGMSAARRITCLDTPAAVHEMARWLGMAETGIAYLLQDGLRSSRHGPEAIIAMRELLSSPSEPIPPIFLQTLAALDKRPKNR